MAAGVIDRIRDWWRGFSDADIASLERKLLRVSDPGAIIALTDAEAAALRASHRRSRPWTVDRDGTVRTNKDRPVVLWARAP